MQSTSMRMQPPPRRCTRRADETRRPMLLRAGALHSRGRSDAEGAMPLPRVPIHLWRLSQHVCPDAARRLQLYQGNAQTIYPQRSRRRRDAGILRRMRHAYAYAPAGIVRGDSKMRSARRSRPVWQPAYGDLHDRQAGFPSYPGRHAGLRAIAEALAARETQHLVVPAKRANGSRERAPDDRLHEREPGPIITGRSVGCAGATSDAITNIGGYVSPLSLGRQLEIYPPAQTSST